MNDLYENDYDLWIEKQKQFLLDKDIDKLDIENLIEELESLSKQDRKELASYLTVLLIHLLKYDYQKNTLMDTWVEYHVLNNWMSSIIGSRVDIQKCLESNPNLKHHIEDCLKDGYKWGKKKAIKEMNCYIKDNERKLNDKSFPNTCPWSFDIIIDEDWLPEDRSNG